MRSARNVKGVASDFQYSNLISQLQNPSQAQCSTLYTGIFPGQQVMLENQSSVFTQELLHLSLKCSCVSAGHQQLLVTGAQHCGPCRSRFSPAEVSRCQLAGDPGLWAVSAVLQSGTSSMPEGKCWKIQTALCSHCCVTVRLFIALSFRAQCRWELQVTRGMQGISFLSFYVEL